jgi:hypothetical protein
VYNVDNYFILFFKHIVQAKGLALLIDSGENFERTKMTDKNDNFIMNLMLSIYDDSEELEKEKYVSGI